MKLTLMSIEKSGVIHIAAEGDITSKDFGDNAKNPMETVLGHNWATSSVIFDLSKTSFIDSSAVGWLIDCQRRFKERNGRMALHSPTPRVRDVIDLLKMRTVLNVQDSAAAAATQLNAPK
jgi:anti-anti-sigma factor